MYKEILPIKLKQARKEAGIKQEEVADIINISRATISKYENGQLEPNIETLGMLADFYEVSADWLIGTKGGKK
jgi:transcriptional regulator with XRE-family HTH domain